MQQYFAPQNQPSSTPPSSTPSSSTSPAPQGTQKEENEQLLQQTIVKENIMQSTTKSITKHDSSIVDSKSTLSTIPRLCIARSSGDSAIYGNALLLAYLLNYIKHSKDLEATEQE